MSHYGVRQTGVDEWQVYYNNAAAQVVVVSWHRDEASARARADAANKFYVFGNYRNQKENTNG